ncbi:hypothetical protein LSTR_LSTR000589 [Laodelphax striatellus]|uniref:Uncharacterized protein n=1 Tax=Laodelphax striatellus TaxID=195883 RepID=A0A482XFX7_LAOST|nr:hypothetical protein LSTR_LSTR000589 [Laodelphax striatellus]
MEIWAQTRAASSNPTVMIYLGAPLKHDWCKGQGRAEHGSQHPPQSVLIGKGIPIFTDDAKSDAAATAKRPQATAAAGRVASRKSLQFSAATLADLKENQPNFRVPALTAAPRFKTGRDDVGILPDGDFADTTCNTRAFQLALPSSTPLITHPLRASSMANQDNNCSMLLADGSHKPNTELSIIMEASKELYSR